MKFSAAILFAFTFRLGTGSQGDMSKDQDSPSKWTDKPGRRLSSKKSKAAKLPKAPKTKLEPRKRNNLLTRGERHLPSEGKAVGKLLKEFEFNFTSYIIVGDGEEYQSPFNQIYERCGPYPYLNYTDGILQAPVPTSKYYTPDGSFWKGGCVGGYMEGDLNGLYLSGAYTQQALPSNYLNFHTFQSDVFGPNELEKNYPEAYPYAYNDWSSPGWPDFSLFKGSGWILTDFCREDGVREWIHFFTTIIGINHQMFSGKSYGQYQNIYAMDVDKSRGCKGKYITFILYSREGYSNPKSREEGYIHTGTGCPPDSCTVNGRMYELEDLDE